MNYLAHFLCNLPRAEADNDEIVISDIKVARADLVEGSDDTYLVGMYVYLNEGGSENDDLKISVKSYSEDGTVTGNTNFKLTEEREYGVMVSAKYGDTIQVVVEGTQSLGKGVYFYEPKGGRDVSQSLVGVGEGQTKVRAEETFIFEPDVDMGLRIYKTETGTGKPISDIVFDICKVKPEAGDTVSEVPTEEIKNYAAEENKAASVITDTTGYASVGLQKGTYLVVEQHNSEKTIAPVDPFYIIIPMAVEKEAEDGTVVVETEDIVSVYPKNEPPEGNEPPPIIPHPPAGVKGKFKILKHDAENRETALKGAEFKVYRPAAEGDTDTETIQCDGTQYAVVPVMVDGKCQENTD